VVVGDLVFTTDEVLGLSEDRKRLLGELAVFGSAIADSALPELGRPWIEARETDLLWRRIRAQEALDSAGVGDDVLEARYRTEPELELTVRHLLVFSARYETDATRAAAREKAEAALARVRAGEAFSDVAAEVSEEPGADTRAGLLTPGREGSWVTEFWTAAGALAPGEISPVVETQFGFHVLRLEARDTVPFAEARPRLALEVADLMGFRGDDLDALVIDDLPEAPDGAAWNDPTRSDDEPVARGAEWNVSLGDLRDAAALLTYAERRSAASDPALRDATFETAARRAMVRARAGTVGVSLTDADRATIVRDWVDRGDQWALQLGFAPGIGAEGVRRAALAALSDNGQNASLARDALRDAWGGLLHRWMPIRVEETSTPGGA
jgi:hypothetical protein